LRSRGQGRTSHRLARSRGPRSVHRGSPLPGV